MLFAKQAVPELDVAAETILEIPVVRVSVLIAFMMAVYTSGLLILEDRKFTTDQILGLLRLYKSEV